jgi:hypothetical protein
MSDILQRKLRQARTLMESAAILPDIGKIGVRDAVLLKHGCLDADEMQTAIDELKKFSGQQFDGDIAGHFIRSLPGLGSGSEG